MKQEIAIVVDRSGSMNGKERDTVGGINASLDTLKEKKEEDTTINVSLKLFDHQEIIHWNRVDITSLEPFNVASFVPRGQTALLDAMGNTIKFFLDKKNENSDEFDSCVIYVATDGYENSSRNYNRQSIKELIEVAERDADIKVLYLAANQNAILEAANLGIASNRAIDYSETQENVNAVYRAAASYASRSRSRPNDQSGFLTEERVASQGLDTGDTNTNAVPPPPPSTRRGSRSVPRNFGEPVISDAVKHEFLDAAKNYEWGKVERMADSYPGIINTNICNRWTALHQAAESGNHEIVVRLLSKGADKNIRNRENKLPVEVASNTDIIQVLQEEATSRYNNR